MATADRPISAVLSDIVGNVQSIVRCELRLVKREAAEELGQARSAGLLLGLGGLMIAFSVLFMLLACLYALALILPGWVAALIVAAVVGAAAAVCIGLGLARIKAVRAVPRTIASMKENAEWARRLSS